MSENAKILPLIPLSEGLFIIPESASSQPCLLASACRNCGEVHFPRRETNECPQCQMPELEDIQLSGAGATIAAFTVVQQKPAGGFYHGEVPFAYGFVDLPEGVRVQTLFKGDFNALKIGEKADLAIGDICQDNEGRTVVTYMFEQVPTEG